MQGLADACGVSVNTIIHFHMLGEITRGACSQLGAWGPAVPLASSLLQMRALDWDMDGPFRNFPLIHVRHPSPGEGQAFLTIGYMGFIGAITGLSSAQMAIGEIGVSYPDATFGEESWVGVPFVFLMRDVMQWDATLEAGLARIHAATRTCNLILGLGDAKVPMFNGIEYGASVDNVFNDTDMMPYNQTWHPRIPGTVYYGMDWLCPSFSEAIANQIKLHYGNLTATVGMQQLSAMAQTGTNHVVWVDYAQHALYTSFAAPLAVQPPAAVAAFDRPYFAFNYTALFDEPAPQ